MTAQRFCRVDPATHVVVNVELWEAAPDVSCFPSDKAGQGWSYDPVTGGFSPPAPPPPTPPATVTNSDWRVALILWKRPDGTARFDEVEAKVTAARDSGTDQGKIVWQRWEYANDVYRAELLALHDQFGFTTDEVDESLLRAQAVSSQAQTTA